MKKTLIFLNMLLLVLMVVFTANIFLNSIEMEEELTAQRKITDKQISELQKEIRLLKMDIYILENGYEGKLMLDTAL